MSFFRSFVKGQKVENQPSQSIEERIIAIVAKQFGVETKKINLETELVSDLGMDSLESIELLMELEEEFSVGDLTLNVPDNEAEKLLTVGDIIDYITQKL